MNFNVLESSVDRYRQSAVRVQLQGIVSIKFTWDTIRSNIWLFYAINVLLSCIPSGCLVENVILLSKLVKNCLSCLMYPNSFLFVALCACVWVWECKKGLKITHFICLNISSFVPIFGLRSFVLIQLKYFGIIRIYSTITWDGMEREMKLTESELDALHWTHQRITLQVVARPNKLYI